MKNQKEQQKKIIIATIIVAAIVNALGMFVFYMSTSQFLEQAIIDHLETTATSRANHIETFLDGQKKKARIVADNPVYGNFLLTDVRSEENAREVFETLLRLQEVNEEIVEISLTDKDGVVIISTDEVRVGTFDDFSLYMRDGTSSEYERDVAIVGRVHYSERTQKNHFHVAAPIVKDDTGFIGAIVLGIRLDELATITTERTGLRETGEIVLINRDGLLLTPSRFLGGNAGILVQELRTENAAECIEDLAKSEADEAFDDAAEVNDFRFSDSYTGARTIGVDVPLEEVEWCVLAEIAEFEVLGEARQLLFIILIATILGTIGFVSFVNFALARRFLGKNMWGTK